MILRRVRRGVFTFRRLTTLLLGFIFYWAIWAMVTDEGLPSDSVQEMGLRVQRDTDRNAGPDTLQAPMTSFPVDRKVMGKTPASDIAKPEARTPTPKLVTRRFNSSKQVNISHNCHSWYDETLEGNLNVIRNYPVNHAQQYLRQIGGNLSRPQQIMTSFPVIVTAANGGFYDISQGLLKTIHTLLLPKYGDVKIIYYDMGLSQYQLKQLQQHCKCEVRRFPFEDFPEHVKTLKYYAWKPIIVQTLLMEFGWVWYMDSSARFLTDDLDGALDYSRENSILFFTYGPVLSVAQHTDVRTMAYLGEDGCKYRYFGEIEAGFVLYHFDDVTKAVVNKWTSCALIKGCIGPPGSLSKMGCNKHDKQDGGCHRFDQSVLSIMLRRLFHDINDYPMVETPIRIHAIRRGNRVNYFPKIGNS